MQNYVLPENDILLLHQLRILEWFATQNALPNDKIPLKNKSTPDIKAVPELWNLTLGTTLYAWQEDCIKKWFNGRRGTVKVVTGAGKTILALAIMQKLQNDIESELHVAIVVPTIVLMNQWYDELLTHGNLPVDSIGRLGGNYTDDFSSGKKVLISVLASAQRKLPAIVSSSNVGSNLLLVVDECHRSGAEIMSRIFETKRQFNLGLSATPEREEEEMESLIPYDKTLLGNELGPIIYELNLAEALGLGIIPPFKVIHYGISMNPNERIQYEKLSREITDLEKELRGTQRKGKGSSSPFYRWVRTIAARDKSSVGELAGAFMNKVRRRKELLYKIESRGEAVEQIVAFDSFRSYEHLSWCLTFFHQFGGSRHGFFPGNDNACR